MGDAISFESENQRTFDRNVESRFFSLTRLVGIEPDCNMAPALLRKGERTVKCILQGGLSWRICFLELGA